MKDLRILIPLLFLLLLVNCNGEDYSHELSEIDSLKTVLTETDSLITSLNNPEITQRAQDIADNSKFIQFNVNKLGDTLDYSTALLLTEYRETGVKFRFVSDELTRLSMAIDSMYMNLDNLKHDLENHSLAEGVEGKASVTHVSSQVNVLSSYSNELRTTLDNTRHSYDTLLPKVNACVNRINARVAPMQMP